MRVTRFYPKNIMWNHSDELARYVSLVWPKSLGKPPRAYVVRSWRGRAYYQNESQIGAGKLIEAPGIITIPYWAWIESVGRLKQYVAHELAHLIVGRAANHGRSFQEQMKKLCPKEHWHYEAEYKPRLAAAAGIAKKR